MVRVHGYSINPSQVDQALLLFGQNGYSEVTNINPTTGFYAINPSAFVLSKLSDNTYRNFYLYVSSDGSEAYLVHFIQSIFQ